MVMMNQRLCGALFAFLSALAGSYRAAAAQGMPGEYREVLKYLDKSESLLEAAAAR
jgi:hypothetical protein